MTTSEVYEDFSKWAKQNNCHTGYGKRKFFVHLSERVEKKRTMKGYVYERIELTNLFVENESEIHKKAKERIKEWYEESNGEVYVEYPICKLKDGRNTWKENWNEIESDNRYEIDFAELLTPQDWLQVGMAIYYEEYNI